MIAFFYLKGEEVPKNQMGKRGSKPFLVRKAYPLSRQLYQNGEVLFFWMSGIFILPKINGTSQNDLPKSRGSFFFMVVFYQKQEELLYNI